jgi:hypothetical protein
MKMKTRVVFAILAITVFLSFFKTDARSLQDRTFKDPGGKYELTLREGWEPVSYKDGGGNLVTDIIFENRERGLLRIREMQVDENLSAEAMARRELEMSIRFQPGYAFGSLEPFKSTHYADGAALSFDFTFGGRRKTARYYYLKVSENTFYALRFEGDPGVLRTMRNRTDLMARSFRVLR